MLSAERKYQDAEGLLGVEENIKSSRAFLLLHSSVV